MATFISFMKSLNHWKCSNRSKLKLKINSTKGLKTSDLTMVVNTMVSMTVQVNNIQDHLLNSTMPGSLSMNGVAERRNITLKDMVRSVISYSNLPISIWGEALKTAAYIFNRVPTKATAKTPYELWIGKKPSLKHLHIWGCLAEARPYRPHGKKLDSRTVSCYFIGYSERSRDYKFYDPTTKSIFETRNAWFFEDVEFDGGDKDTDFVFEEKYVDIPTTVIDIDQAPVLDIVQEADPNQNNIQEPPIPEEQTLPPPEPTPLRRSTRERRSEVSDDYIVFLQEHEFDIGVVEDDPINFRQALENSKFQEWIDAMNEEKKSMKDNDVWDLVPLPEGVKLIGCKWIFKTKRDSRDDVERYKARLVAKGYTQKESINYKGLSLRFHQKTLLGQ